MKRQLALSVAVLLAAWGTAAQARASGYAEGIYADYERASAGAVKFRVQKREAGALAEIAGLPMRDLLGIPAYLLQADNVGLELDNLALAQVDSKSLYLGDLDATVDGFEQVGFPLAKGRYRLLDVTLASGKGEQHHAALEVCFAAQDHCVLYDPSVEFIDSEVNALREAKASGWAITEHHESAAPHDLDDLSKAGRCGLASNPGIIGLHWTQPRHTYTWKNVFGVTLVSKDIGETRWGVRCDAYCRPQPYGYAHESSAWSNIPYSVDCDNETNSGTSGSSGKFVARTGCSHRLTGGANISLTKSGVGLSVEVNVDVTGSVTRHGGSMIDRCAYF